MFRASNTSFKNLVSLLLLLLLFEGQSHYKGIKVLLIKTELEMTRKKTL